MNEYETLITKFYEAFSKRDWKTMQSCYHPDIVFYDPAFQKLKGLQAYAMWHMLAESAQNFSLTFTNVTATPNGGSCHWEAYYDFSRTGRRVHNSIDAQFSFRDGKIIAHSDRFDLWRWSRMALGIPGILLGWSPFLQNKVRQTALKTLGKFIEKHPEYQ